MSHDGKGFLVTGGGSGIGQQVCLLAAAAGASIAVADIDLGNAQGTAAQCARRTGLPSLTPWTSSIQRCGWQAAD